MSDEIDKLYENWLAAYRKSMGWELQYDDLHERVAKAFRAGYNIGYMKGKEDKNATGRST